MGQSLTFFMPTLVSFVEMCVTYTIVDEIGYFEKSRGVRGTIRPFVILSD